MENSHGVLYIVGEIKIGCGNKMKIKEIVTCKNDEWGTPQDFFDELDKKFNFTLDPCANEHRKLKKDMISLSIGANGLQYNWKNHSVFCNPPYSKENFKLWCKKINDEKTNAKVIVLLCPLRRCSNIYFHDLILQYAKLKIIRGV